MKRISLRLKILIIIYFFVGLAFCFLANPYLYGIYFENTIGNKTNIEIISYIINLLCSVPCFILLFLGFKVSIILEKDETLISHEGSKILKIAGFMLSIDSLVFFISHLIFAFFIKNWVIEASLAFLGFIGLTIGALLIVVSYSLNKATLIKEDNEAII